MKYSELKALIEGKSFKRNDEEGDKKKKQDKQRRKARDDKNKPVEEGKSFKRNKDDDVDQKKKDDKQRRDSRDDKKNQPVEEGKSFKRNKDDNADQKKKDDQQRRGDRKREPVEESRDIKKGAFHKWLGKSEDDKITQADIDKGLRSNDAHVRKMAQFAKNMEESVEVEEGKSFKRNKDGDVDQKKKDDKQRRDNRDNKKNQPVEEGKSFKRNDDDSKSKKAKDDERKKGRDDKQKQRTDESVSPSTIMMLQDHGYDVEFVPPHFRNNGDMDEQYSVTYLGEFSDFPDVIGKAYDKEDAWDQAAEHFKQHQGKTESSGRELGEAADISFNDAKAELPDVKNRLGQMSPFHPDYIKTKARHDKLQDRLSRMNDDELDEDDMEDDAALEEAPVQVGDHISYTFVNSRPPKTFTGTVKSMNGDMIQVQWDEENGHYAGPSESDCQQNGIHNQEYPLHWAKKMDESMEEGCDDELDEASDISFNDAKAELPQVKHRLSKMSPFHPDYVKTKAHHDKLQDRLSRMNDDELDEAEGESWCVVAGTGKVVAGPFADQAEASRHIKYPGEHAKQGTPKSLSMRNESYVSDTNGYGGDSMDVCEDGEEHDHEIGEDVVVSAGKYKGMEGKVTKIGPGPYKVVQLKGGKQVRLENSEMKCAASESYVSGDDSAGSDDVIEDLNMEDFCIPRDEAKGLADEVETKKDGKPVSASEIERLKQLAGLNKI
jgi:hypothetical protein